MAGRNRVRLRQNAGLHAEADEGQQEYRRPKRLMVLQGRAISGEIGACGDRAEQHEQDQQERRS